jgi:uncharacterized protein
MDEKVLIMNKPNNTSRPNVERIRAPGGMGRSFNIQKGHFLAILDIHGGQCVDFWAIDANNFDHFLSSPHTITHLLSTQPKIGDQLVTNKRQPILTIISDDVGWHDLIFSACDRQRYLNYFNIQEHRNCHDNFLEAISEYDWGSRLVPNPPFNIFMNTSIDSEGRLQTGEPRSKPGDCIIMQAEMDLICVVSICPMDLTPTGSSGITDVDILISADVNEIDRALKV